MRKAMDKGVLRAGEQKRARTPVSLIVRACNGFMQGAREQLASELEIPVSGTLRWEPGQGQ